MLKLVIGKLKICNGLAIHHHFHVLKHFSICKVRYPKLRPHLKNLCRLSTWFFHTTNTRTDGRFQLEYLSAPVITNVLDFYEQLTQNASKMHTWPPFGQCASKSFWNLFVYKLSPWKNTYFFEWPHKSSRKHLQIKFI